MKRGQVFILTGCVVLCLVTLTVLYTLSPIGEPIYRAGFERKFVAIRDMSNLVMDMKVNSFYVAGYSDRTLFMGNSTSPFNMLTANLELTDSTHVVLKLAVDSISSPEYFRIYVEPPYFYLANGVQPVILKGSINNWTAAPFLKDENFFTDMVPIDNGNFALKSYGGEKKEYDLAEKTIDNFTFKPDLLEKQVDGLFCVDGRLLFNRKSNQVVYQYFYRNQFIVSDTNLNLIYRGHTIDTFSRVRVNVAKIGDGSRSMLSAPPVVINGLSCTDGDYLYIQSNLLAKNEDIERFRAGCTIDYYQLKDGKYSGSFHIPNYKKLRMQGFQVIGDKLFAIFGRYLVRYDLSSGIFEGHKNR